MPIYETGILFNSIPIVQRFYQNQKTDHDRSLLSAGFFSALESFAGEIFSDDVQSFKMVRYSVFIKRINVPKNVGIALLYGISDNVKEEPYITKALHSKKSRRRIC